MTPRPFSFGVQPRWTTPGGPTRSDVTERALAIEAAGYRDFFVADHFGGVDPFAVALTAALATTTLRVGTLVLDNELHHPALLARTAATVDRLIGGRLVLGCGTGYSEEEHAAAGIVHRPPRDRVTRFAESMAALRLLLDEGVADMDGRHIRVAVTDLGVRAEQSRLPILIGGHGRRVVTVAAEHADVFQFTGLVHEADGTPTAAGFPISQVVERAEWLERAAGERSNEIERSALVQVTVVRDDIDLDVVAAEVDLSAALVQETPFVLAGSVGQIVEKLQRLRETVGISHYVVRDAEGFAPVVAALAGS